MLGAPFPQKDFRLGVECVRESAHERHRDVVVVAGFNACDRPWRGSHTLRELALGKVQFLAKLENLGGEAELLCRRLVLMSCFGILQLFVLKRSW